MQSWSTDFLPFLAMVIVECGEMGMITLGKAAMNDGLNNLVYVVYYNALGTLFLLPFLIFHRCSRFVKIHQCAFSYFLKLTQSQSLICLFFFFFFQKQYGSYYLVYIVEILPSWPVGVIYCSTTSFFSFVLLLSNLD